MSIDALIDVDRRNHCIKTHLVKVDKKVNYYKNINCYSYWALRHMDPGPTHPHLDVPDRLSQGGNLCLHLLRRSRDLCKHGFVVSVPNLS